MMIRFLDFVESEVDRIAVHLEGERAGTGVRFAIQYLAVLDKLVSNPHFYPRVEDPLPLAKFAML